MGSNYLMINMLHTCCITHGELSIETQFNLGCDVYNNDIINYTFKSINILYSGKV